ncbi:Uncharacterised protein [Vibrio cholerae]|nr:Uncharacterised protein [Vibrio cholerae]
MNWQKRMSTLTQQKSRFQFVQPCTTPWVVSKPMANVKPALKVCSPWVNVRLLVCMARTV